MLDGLREPREGRPALQASPLAPELSAVSDPVPTGHEVDGYSSKKGSMTDSYDLAVIGAGSAGITAARFAAHAGARVVLIEKDRIGGDCTWTGCVPSKALLKVARVAHQARQASQYGLSITTSEPVDLESVMGYVRRAIERVYRYETPETLQQEGVEVLMGQAGFVDAHTLTLASAESRATISAKRFVLCPGARVKGVAAREGHGGAIVRTTEVGEVGGDALLVATGRRPNVDTMDLPRAGVAFTAERVLVDKVLRTNIKHIYAAGDVVGGPQFTHYAGYQAFVAARNALFPGASKGIVESVPWTTFTDPELARAGLSEAEARQKHREAGMSVSVMPMEHVDRAVVENDAEGFIKVVHKKDGTVVGRRWLPNELVKPSTNGFWPFRMV